MYDIVEKNLTNDADIAILIRRSVAVDLEYLQDDE